MAMSLEIRNLSYRYVPGFSLQDICVTFQNSITGIIGPNGAGKSTLIKCIANILEGSGDIYYGDLKINRNDRTFYPENVSYLPQLSPNDATITVFEAVLLGLINSLKFRVHSAQVQAVNAMLDMFELQPLAHRRICELSGGQLQMVLLAQAIIKQPGILLLDEPLNNLDIHHQFELMNLISKLTKQNDMITILVMHDINLTARYADNIIVMDNGKLHSQGIPRDVLTKEMLKEIYHVEANIRLSMQGYPVIEFLDITDNS
jgi:iron complex transport system ATP-binding protein